MVQMLQEMQERTRSPGSDGHKFRHYFLLKAPDTQYAERDVNAVGRWHCHATCGGFPNFRVLSGGPYNKDYNILGSK